MGGPLSLQLVPLVVEDQHRVKLIGANVIQADMNAEAECGAHVQRASDDQPRFGGLRRLQQVEGAMIATAAIGRVRLKAPGAR